MPGPHTLLNLDEIDDVAPATGLGEQWEARLVRTAVGAEQVGITHFRLRPGKRSPFAHRHTYAEEIYIVLDGHGRAKLNEEVLELAPRDVIRVASEVTRAFEAGPNGLELLAIGVHHPLDGAPAEDPWGG